MLNQTIFMIRNGSFGTDFTLKLFMTALGIFICLYDWHTQKRKDYFWVFLTGSIIWFVFESILQLTGIRVMSGGHLLGWGIPLWLSSLFRGTAEGGLIAIIGLLFGDRIAQRHTRKKWLAIFFVFLAAVAIKTLTQGPAAVNVGGEVASRRNIFYPPVAILLAGCLIFDVLWFLKTDLPTRLRAMYMFGVMVVLGAVWTTAEYVAHTRWIEIGTMGSFYRAPPLIEFSVFTWDVVAEIALAYLPFLAIPSLLGLMRSQTVASKPSSQQNGSKPSARK